MGTIGEMAELRVREEEYLLLAGLLEEAAAGRGGLVLLEGGPGSGKSDLLSRLARAAGARGFAVCHAAADHLAHPGFLGPAADWPGPDDPAPSAAGGADPGDPLRRIAGWLESGTADRPVLVALDDLQWADAATVAALRTFCARPLPALVVLARRRDGGGHPVDRLFTALAAQGAQRRVLGPLAEDAAVDLLTEVLGAPPTAEQLDLCSAAQGVPAVLCELAGALRDGAALAPAASHAQDPADGLPLPEPVREIAVRPLAGLSAHCRALLEVAAVLGRSFSLGDLTDLYHRSTLELMPAVQEAVTADVLCGEGSELRFRHTLVWRAVREHVPAPVRSALCRELGELLLGRGEFAAASEHLAGAVRAGDERAVDALDRAARELLVVAPRRAVELLNGLGQGPHTPGRAALRVTAVLALIAEGRLALAAESARAALAGCCAPAAAAELRAALATVERMTGELPAHPEVTSTGAAVVRSSERDHESSTALPRVRELWRAGRADEALGRLRAAASRPAGPRERDRHGGYHADPRPELATVLVQLREFAAADQVIGELAKEIDDLGLPAWRPVVLAPRALLALESGNADEAGAHAEAVLNAADGARVAPAVLLALSVQGELALRRGDLHQAAESARRLRPLLAGRCPAPGAGHALWTTLRIAEAEGGPDAVLAALAEYAEHPEPEHRAAANHASVHGGSEAVDLGARLAAADERTLRALLLATPAAAVWLARVARAAGRDDVATRISGLAREIAALNPGQSALATAAAHADALLRGDQAALRDCAAGHRDGWARAGAEEDLGLLLLGEAPGGPEAVDRPAAVDRLQAALQGYEACGSAPDAARVRSLLRRLGVRGRHWTYASRPATGWASLTDTERAVADMVAHGLTNREAAKQLFLSPYTVNFHLRQIFRKLGISSRVELARLERDRDRDLVVC
jgi:DNA-binding CsgD family transcriptional regulator/tetratricopeptide (TPR) repeat protein